MYLTPFNPLWTRKGRTLSNVIACCPKRIAAYPDRTVFISQMLSIIPISDFAHKRFKRKHANKPDGLKGYAPHTQHAFREVTGRRVEHELLNIVPPSGYLHRHTAAIRRIRITSSPLDVARSGGLVETSDLACL